jgi:hypothetical protein
MGFFLFENHSLMIASLPLYYDQESIWEMIVNANWVIGLLFFIIFFIHAPMGLNKQARS